MDPVDAVDAVEQADVTSRVGDLVGREHETRVLEALVSHAPTHGAALVLRGPAGVGKTALLSVACDTAARRGMGVWRVSGVSAEMCVPLAGLHQILWPMLERAHDLDRPYREILLPSFGVGCRPTSGSFMIAVATLELLSVVAAEAPLLMVVDDAHWLDRETWEVLGFVARRLVSHSVVLVMAAREGYRGDLVRTLGIPEFEVMPLDERSSAAILAAKAPDLDPECRARVIAEAAGNPMALVELSALDQCAASTFGRPDRLSMTPRLQSALVDRFLHLPPATQALLVVASIDDRATVYEIVRAATVVGDGCHPTVDDLTPALESGLVEPDNTRVHFCHPLTAAAIYDTCSAGTRRRAHDALAGTLATNEYRRSWHRAAAAIPPDEVAGNALEMAVMNSGSQTRPNLLPAALERAAMLSSEEGVRQKRLLRAVELALDLGQRSRAEQLLGEVRPHECAPVEYARLGLVRDMVVAGLVRDPSTVQGLIEASIEAGATRDSAVAWRLLRAAAVRSWWADLGADMRCRIASAAGQLSAADDDPTKLSVLATVDPGRCIEALLHLTSQKPAALCEPETAFLLGIALHFCGAFDRSSAYLSEAIPGLGRQGYRGVLPEALAFQAWNGIYVANLDEAATTAQEAIFRAREQRQPLWEAMGSATLSLLNALGGNGTDAELHLADADAIAVPLGARSVLADTQFARAVLASSTGRYEEAFEHLERTFNPRDPAHHYLRSDCRIDELAEAALYAGRADEARVTLANLEADDKWAFSTRARVGCMYARALLANDEAELLFQTALDADLTSWPLHWARFNLQYGMWLRRRRKISQSRRPLRTARDLFSALGANALAERARLELRASREQQHNGPEARLELTEQEHEVARLAARGLSNREIGERLYISPRTVGSHLYKIFPKLGVASRAQLSLVLEERELVAVS